MTTPPTRRQIDEMTRVQSEKRAQNDAAECRYPRCSCVVNLSNWAGCKFAPSAGTCITPSQGADHE